MLYSVLKSKIHRARITCANVDYVGSIEVDKDLMDAVNLVENEKVLVANIENGNRFETYAISGKRGSGIIGLNGAAALLGKVGDLIIIFSFAMVDENELRDFSPGIIVLNNKNKIEIIDK